MFSNVGIFSQKAFMSDSYNYFYDSYMLLHYVASTDSTLPWTDIKNGIKASLDAGTVTYDINRGYYFDGSSTLQTTGANSFNTSYPIYFVVYNYSAGGFLIVKNSNQDYGFNSSGRYLGLDAYGRYRQNDSQGTLIPGEGPISNNLNILCYSRYSNDGTSQRKRHFVNVLDETIYSQETLSYTSNSGDFVIGGGFTFNVETLTGYIKEIILYDGSTLTDVQRDDLINGKFKQLLKIYK